MPTATSAPDLPASLAHTPAAASHTPTPPIDRLHALDALRALAMFLGVVLHAALCFMTFDIPFTPRMDSSRSGIFNIVVFTIHAFRMQAFFLVAGYFAALLLSRRTPGTFLRNRALRIGLPLVVGSVTIVPLTILPFLLAHDVPITPATLPTLVRAPAHLWFLIYLCVFCIAAAVYAAVLERAPHGPGNGGLLARVAASTWAVPLMILPTVVLNLTMPSWSIDTPWGWLPRPTSLAYYGLFFATGYALHRAGSVGRVGRSWRWMLPLTLLVLVPAFLYFAGSAPVAFEYGGWSNFLTTRAAVLPTVIAQAAVTWGMVCSLLGLFMHCCSNPRPWVRWCADSSYWVYLLHLPIVYFLNLWLASWTIPGIPAGPLTAIIKFLLILSATVALCLITYALFVRPTPLERIIGGSGKKPRSLNDIPAATPSPG